MHESGFRRLCRMSAAVALALTGQAGIAAAQEVPTTFAPRPLLPNYTTISNLIGTTMTF